MSTSAQHVRLLFLMHAHRSTSAVSSNAFPIRGIVSGGIVSGGGDIVRGGGTYTIY